MTKRPLYAAATVFRRLLLRDLDLDGPRSESGTLCQPVTSGIDGGCDSAEVLAGRCSGELERDAISERGAFGRRMPPSRGGDCDAESRGIGNVVTAGELKDEFGTEPDDARETESSQSLDAPAIDGAEPFEEDTDDRRCRGSALSRDSFFTTGVSLPTFGLPAAAFGCFLVLLPARSSSKRSGRGRRCVRS